MTEKSENIKQEGGKSPSSEASADRWRMKAVNLNKASLTKNYILFKPL
jgi:hypothetical protein